jgi:hypothetical protein
VADDKLSIIAGELAQTGNNIPAVADDGSDEWTVCSAAYDTAVQETIEAHSWNFDTQIATLVRVGDSPDNLYDDAYAKPDQSLHLIWVRLNDRTVDYKIINNLVCLSAAGLPVTAKYVIDQGPANWPPLFSKIIRLNVRAAIYSGLHEDPQTGLMYEKLARDALAAARTRVDQESPKRAPFNSRAIYARRVRRPFINSPAGWSGTDVPN